MLPPACKPLFNVLDGAELCDCTDGTLTQCDTLTDADKDDCDDGENGASYQHVSMFILALQVCFMILG